MSYLGKATVLRSATELRRHYMIQQKKGPNRELNPGPLPVLRAPLRVSKFSRREYNTTILLGRSVKHGGPIEVLIQITLFSFCLGYDSNAN